MNALECIRFELPLDDQMGDILPDILGAWYWPDHDAWRDWYKAWCADDLQTGKDAIAKVLRDGTVIDEYTQRVLRFRREGVGDQHFTFLRDNDDMLISVDDLQHDPDRALELLLDIVKWCGVLTPIFVDDNEVAECSGFVLAKILIDNTSSTVEWTLQGARPGLNIVTPPPPSNN